MRTWCGLSANRMLAGMRLGALEATMPVQFWRISGLVRSCADAVSRVTSVILTASITIIDRRTRPAMRCSCARRSSTLAWIGAPGHRTLRNGSKAKCPARAGHCKTFSTRRSARRCDRAARRDHDPAAVRLLMDRLNAAETRTVVAHRHFDRAVAAALDERRIAIDVTHRPACHRTRAL